MSNKYDQVQIGKKLKNLMDEHNLNITEVSKGTSISTPYLSQIQNDKREPSLKIIKQLATFFQIPMSYFFDDEIQINRPAQVISKHITKLNIDLGQLSTQSDISFFHLAEVLKGKETLTENEAITISDLIGVPVFELQVDLKEKKARIRHLLTQIQLEEDEIGTIFEYIDSRLKDRK